MKTSNQRLKLSALKKHIEGAKRKVRVKQSGFARIGYTPVGRKLVAKFPGIMRAFTAGREAILSGKAALSTHQIKGVGMVKVRKQALIEGIMHTHGFIVEATDARHRRKYSFFVKEQEMPGRSAEFRAHLDMAHPQIKALEKAYSALGKIAVKGVGGVEVADYYLAYTQGNHSFLVTKFYSDAISYTHLPTAERNQIAPLIERLRHEFEKGAVGREVTDVFNGILIRNLLWSSSRKKLIMIDLRPNIKVENMGF